jgi:hypothetical protein
MTALTSPQPAPLLEQMHAPASRGIHRRPPNRSSTTGCGLVVPVSELGFVVPDTCIGFELNTRMEVEMLLNKSYGNETKTTSL